jgi:hypothetical protein
VGELRRRRGSWPAERAADGGLVEAVLAQQRRTTTLLPQDSQQQACIHTGMAEVADRQLAVAEPDRHGATLAQGALEIEAHGRVDELAQGLVAAAPGRGS